MLCVLNYSNMNFENHLFFCMIRILIWFTIEDKYDPEGEILSSSVATSDSWLMKNFWIFTIFNSNTLNF